MSQGFDSGLVDVILFAWWNDDVYLYVQWLPMTYIMACTAIDRSRPAASCDRQLLRSVSAASALTRNP